MQWNTKWFTNKAASGHWKNWNSQRIFFDNLSKKLNIKRPSDWSNVNKQVLAEHGAGSLLTYHKGSKIRLMESVYPGFVFTYYVIF